MSSLGIRYVREIRPLEFPESDPEWEMGEGQEHQLLCQLFRDSLSAAAGPGASVGCDQFVYFDASDPQRKCAPDGFVKLDVPHQRFDTWKTWEKGTPELCVEILSLSDTRERLPLEEKLRRFHIMGVDEVVAFDADAPIGKRMRAWDLLSGDLIERIVENETTPCRTVGKWLVIRPCSDLSLDAALRLSEDRAGERLVPSPVEAAIARERSEKDRAVSELEAENARLRAELARR